MKATVWYLRYFNLCALRSVTVEDAIDMMRAIEESGDGSVAGIEVDGERLDVETHPHYLQRQEEDERDMLAAEAAPRRLFRLEVLAPPWVGRDRYWVTIGRADTPDGLTNATADAVRMYGTDRVRTIAEGDIS